MSTSQIIKEFIVAEYLPGTSTEELDSSYDLLDTGVVDSLRLLRLIAWVEQQFHIPVDTVDISPDDFRTVKAITAFVENARKA